ncbi:hypothetical protein RA279_28580, partial [Pseudomonas syringae pv. tagetis]|uniref:hypothetical protein n=1 Tax=Pseudomonas syringae group genomosp. 7 TaxID=251699 RepID=UPI00376F8EB8
TSILVGSRSRFVRFIAGAIFCLVFSFSFGFPILLQPHLSLHHGRSKVSYATLKDIKHTNQDTVPTTHRDAPSRSTTAAIA